MRYLTFVLLAIAPLAAVENSVLPFVEELEKGEHFQPEKYSSEEQALIEEALASVSNRLRIVTYNMLFNIRDERLPEEHRWPNRKERVFEMFANLDGDVVCSQELQPDQIEEMLAQFGDRYTFIGEPHGFGNDEVNGIFFRTDRFELIDSQILLLPFAEESKPGGRTLTMVHLLDHQTGEEFAVSNIHFSFGSPEDRALHSHLIAAHLQSYIAAMPTFLCGDLNTFHNRPDLERLPFYDGTHCLRILLSSGLCSSQDQALLGHVGPISSFTNEGQDPTGFLGTGTPGIILDHVLVSDDVKVLVHAIDPGTVDGEFPSDHMPVIVDVVLECVVEAGN